MPNTSATGGYLLQPPFPMYGSALLDFMQSVIVGITGMPGTMVRPAFQPNPPKRPGINVDWCAFFINNQRPEDGVAYIVTDGTGAKSTRHETFDLRCTFYGPNGGSYAGRWRDGLEISQNREPLFLAGMAYVESSSTSLLGELVDEQWYERSDITSSFRRQVDREYGILSFASAKGQIVTETLTIDWAVGPEV